MSEVAIKASLGKLVFPSAVMRQAFHDSDIRVLPYTAEHALRLFDLPLHPGDPFDRQIIAQGLSVAIPIVTPDEQFSNYAGPKVIW